MRIDKYAPKLSVFFGVFAFVLVLVSALAQSVLVGVYAVFVFCLHLGFENKLTRIEVEKSGSRKFESGARERGFEERSGDGNESAEVEGREVGSNHNNDNNDNEREVLPKNARKRVKEVGVVIVLRNLKAVVDAEKNEVLEFSAGGEMEMVMALRIEAWLAEQGFSVDVTTKSGLFDDQKDDPGTGDAVVK